MINYYIDRGGTFTDIYYQIGQESFTYKLLSTEQYQDGVIEGITRIQQMHNKTTNKVVIGTTIVTNAILESKGVKCALLITKGFKDILQIGQQTRPKIFDLTMQKHKNLYSFVIEVDERMSVDGQVIKSVDEQQIQKDIKSIKDQGYNSIAVVLMHSSLYPQHEQIIKKIAINEGIQHISISSEVSKVMKIVPRGLTTVLDAYTTPLLTNYIKKIQSEINPKILLFMTSDGGLVEANEFIGSKALLSGPAGGVVGLVRTTNIYKKLNKKGIIGLDMGGTSTDVCVYYDEIIIKEENVIDNIVINTPSFDIQTVASGGGSILKIENGLLKVGPESSGSYPGPICYGRKGNLSLTDANLLVGNLQASHLPNIFGMNNNEPLNIELVKEKFKEFNTDSIELAKGFIRVADEQMCRPIRSMTNGRGRRVQDHLLFIYGGAGGQHCCQIADILDIDTILIHRYASIFSAYGLSYAQQQLTKVQPYVGEIDEIKINLMLTQNYQSYFHLKYEGSDCLLKIQHRGRLNDTIQRFEIKHQQIFGFKMNRSVKLEYITEKLIFDNNKYENDDYDDQVQLVEGMDMEINQLNISNAYKGPCLIYTKDTTIKINNGWQVQLTLNCNLLIKRIHKIHYQANDLLQLSLFSNRFMAIAEEMGKQLENTAISINIKERLDFSCALFDKFGNLVANAPHLPVHLGSMSEAVIAQLGNFNPGDSIISNHPIMGGSHLPDITVITPFYQENEISFYVASRGHHADIGGITPGSMPPFSKQLNEEGIAIKTFKIVKSGIFQEQELMALFQDSRSINDNIQDLKAQLAANNKGIQLIKQLIEEEGMDVVMKNMKIIQDKACECVQEMLCRISKENNLKEIDCVEDTEYMDDGSKIQLKLTINRVVKSAIFDFTGTSLQVYGNTNCPKSVTKSAILYCLRCLVDLDIPLNQGCLRPTQIILPEQSLLNPSEGCAIVGGNVLTSQRITDLILKCFKASAASQGCMNNFSFGGYGQNSYYETIAGGSGAGPNFHGEHGVQVHMTNTRITDIEVIESKFPIRVLQFTLREGSGGLGKFRGGNGVIRTFQFLDKFNVSLLTERRVYAPFGLLGGSDGERGANLLIKVGKKYNLGSKVNMDVDKGDIIMILTPGGGGYGKE